MASSTDWDYMNENSIHEELFCPICTDPLEEPLCANQCGHTFCRKCITDTFRTMSQCPACRHTLTLEDFRSVTTRPFLNQLNKILVKCKWCLQINIQRGNFKYRAKTCTKIIVSCPAADINCDWKGPGDQIQDHVKICPLAKLKPTIIKLTTTVQQQSKQISFLYTILERISGSHEEACQEEYTKNGTGYCEEEITFDEHKRYLHFCPDTDICLNCVKKNFLFKYKFQFDDYIRQVV